MEQMIELDREEKGGRSIVFWEHENGRKEFVICHNYHEEYPMGSRWGGGQYFQSFVEAADYWKLVKGE